MQSYCYVFRLNIYVQTKKKERDNVCWTFHVLFCNFPLINGIFCLSSARTADNSTTGINNHIILFYDNRNNTKLSQRPQSPMATSNFVNYQNSEYGIKIQYPSDWTASQTGLRDYTNIVAFYSPLKNLTTIVPEYLLLSRTHYSTNVTLSDYSKLVNATIRQPGVRIVESKTISVAGGNPAQKLVFIPPALNVPFKPEIMLVWTAKGNNVYTLSFNGDAVKYPHYLPIIQKMIDSFDITK